jgi:hypothetical protein
MAKRASLVAEKSQLRRLLCNLHFQSIYLHQN